MAAVASLARRRQELDAVVAVVAGGAGNAALLVLGEGGVGKSRLVNVAAHRAAEAGVTVLSGWCLPDRVRCRSCPSLTCCIH
jgi:hypothetical protein